MGCSKCGKKKKTIGAVSVPSQIARSTPQSIMSDNDFVMIEYNHPSMGQHPVHGTANSTGKKTFYGYRKRGDRFLVSAVDQKSFPNFFVPVQTVPSAPKVKITPPPPPVLANGAVKRVVDEEKTEEVEQESPIEAAISVAKFDLDLLPGVTPAIRENMALSGLNTPKAIIKSGERGLRDVKFIGASRAKAIYAYVSERYG